MSQIYRRITSKSNVVVTLFMMTSCVELALGILDMCNVKLPGTRWLLWGFLAIYCLQVLVNKYSLGELICLCSLLVMGGMLYLSSGIDTGIKASIFVFALKGVDRRKLYRSYLITLITVIAGIIVAALLCDFGTLRMYDGRGRGFFDGWRYSLGFANPNLLQLAAFWALIYVVYLFEQSRKVWMLVVSAAVYAGIFVLTASWTGLLVGGFVICYAIMVCYESQTNWNRLLGLSGVFLLIGFVGVSIYAAADLRDNVIMQSIDSTISGRMLQLDIPTNEESYVLPFIQNWKLFSSELNGNWYDMGYIQLFYYYGIVPACVYLAFIFIVMIKAWRKRQTVWLVMMIGLCVYLFMESSSFSDYVTRDILLIVASEMLWRNCNEAVDNVDYSIIQRGKVHRAVS